MVTDEMEKCVTVVTAANAPFAVDVGPVTVAAPMAPVPGVAVPLNQAPAMQAQTAPQQMPVPPQPQAAAAPVAQPAPQQAAQTPVPEPVEQFDLTGSYRLYPRDDPKKALNNEAKGTVVVTRVKDRWDSAKWSFAQVPGEPFVRIINDWKKTALADVDGKLRTERAGDDADSAQWSFEPVDGTPFVQLRNRASGRYLLTMYGEPQLVESVPKKLAHRSYWNVISASEPVTASRPAQGARLRNSYAAAVAECRGAGGEWTGATCFVPQARQFAPAHHFHRAPVVVFVPPHRWHGNQGGQGPQRQFSAGQGQRNTASTAPHFNKNAQSKSATTTPNGTYHLTVTPGAAPSNTATNAAQSNRQGGKFGQIQHGNVTRTKVTTPLGKGVQTTNAKTGVAKVTVTVPTGQAGQTGRITKMTNAKTGVTTTVISGPGGKTVTTTNANTGTTRTITATPTGKSVLTGNAKTGVAKLRTTTANSKTTMTEVRDPKTGQLIRGTSNNTSIDPKTGVVTRTKNVVTQGQTPGLLNAKTRTTTIDPKTGTGTVTKQTSTINTATLKQTVNSSSTKTRQVKTTSGGKSGRTQTANTNTPGGKGSHKSWQHNGKQFGGSNKNASQANNSGGWKNKSGKAGGKSGNTQTANTNAAGGKGSHKSWQPNGNKSGGWNRNKSQANNSGGWKNRSGKAAQSNQAARNSGNHNGSHHWQHHNGGQFQSQGVFGGGGSVGGNWGAVGNAAVGAILSDVRLKHDIVLLKRLDNGIGLYRFRYNWSDQQYVGVMAQEVAAIRPDAVTRGTDGYLRVYYGRLGLRFMPWSEWSKRKLAAH